MPLNEDRAKRNKDKNSKATKDRDKRIIVKDLWREEKQHCRGFDVRGNTKLMREILSKSK